jgi:Fur family ferric uptake transcriptional regulator
MATGKRRRNTPQRRVILQELCQMTSHPTAAELYGVVRRRLPRISLGTVYRNLEVLHDDGLILKMDFSGAEARFDGNTQQHYHVRCTECGKVSDVFSLAPDQSPSQPEELAGYLVTGHRLEYFGTCPECRERDSFPHARNIPGH